MNKLFGERKKGNSNKNEKAFGHKNKLGNKVSDLFILK